MRGKGYMATLETENFGSKVNKRLVMMENVEKIRMHYPFMPVNTLVVGVDISF